MVSIVRRDSIILQFIHLDSAVLIPVHATSRSLLCLPLLLSTVHNFCAWGCFCSSCSINSIAFLSAPRKLVHRRHGKPSIALLNRDPEQANIHSHAIRRCTCNTYTPPRTPDGHDNPSNARSQALDRALTTAGDAAAERARSARLQSVSRRLGGLCWRTCLQLWLEATPGALPRAWEAMVPLGARSPHALFSPCLLVCSSAAGC